MRVLVTGGCGYKGSVLVPKLLARGYDVTVVDTMWFGNYLPTSPRLNCLKADIRDTEAIPVKGTDVIIHLAAIANDPCGDLDPKLTWEVNALATMRLADAAVRAGVPHFIYASSGSVYGIKEEEQVTEDLELKPLSEYNKTKMVAERVVLSYRDDMIVQVVRPATVCGMSPRMRLDVSVNMLTHQALKGNVITVFGGSQHRPNIHIQDITDLYLALIDAGEKLQGVYNAGFENLSIREIAERVTQVVPAQMQVMPTKDLRSYRVNSDKLLGAGFTPRYTVQDAIQEIANSFRKNEFKESAQCFNIQWMKEGVL